MSIDCGQNILQVCLPLRLPTSRLYPTGYWDEGKDFMRHCWSDRYIFWSNTTPESDAIASTYHSRIWPKLHGFTPELLVNPGELHRHYDVTYRLTLEMASCHCSDAAFQSIPPPFCHAAKQWYKLGMAPVTAGDPEALLPSHVQSWYIFGTHVQGGAIQRCIAQLSYKNDSLQIGSLKILVFFWGKRRQKVLEVGKPCGGKTQQQWWGQRYH